MKPDRQNEGWLWREFRKAQKSVSEWPAWWRNIEVPHHLHWDNKQRKQPPQGEAT